MVFLKEELLAGAGLVQGCADGMAQLAAAGDKEEMLQCYWDRIDFCLAKNFPTKEYLKEHFDGMLHERGIYIDERVEIAGGNAVLLGACEAECGVEKYAVSRLYVKHDSRVVIWARDHAFVMVDALDDGGRGALRGRVESGGEPVRLGHGGGGRGRLREGGT